MDKILILLGLIEGIRRLTQIYDWGEQKIEKYLRKTRSPHRK